MNSFKKYIHLERLEKVYDDMFTSHDVEFYTVMPKLDGTNASVWSDESGSIFAGSRNRQLSPEKDNAGFYSYVLNSQEPEMVALRDYLREHPNYIVYGEFLGSGKSFLGAIKNYIENGFFIFDVWDRDTAEFLSHDEWYNVIYPWYSKCIPAIYCDHLPDEKEQTELLKSDFLRYNLPQDENAYPEGMVIKGEPACRDIYGNIVMGKIVLDEFKANKKVKDKPKYEPGEAEEEFVERFVTPAFLSKCQAKVYAVLGENAPQKKTVGMLINLVLDDLMTEEFWGFFKKKKATVDLNKISQLAREKTLKFIL